MENVFNIISIVVAGVGVVNGVVAWFKAVKNGNAAKAEKAKNAINAEIKRLVANAEVTYEAWDKSLKASGAGSAGNMKKDSVVTGLKTFCLENNYDWNAAEMDKAIEDEVAFTKAVNAKAN